MSEDKSQEKRTVEVFTAGCPCCDEAVALVNDLACCCCDVVIHDMNGDGAARAKELGVKRVPAVAVNGELASCCASGGVTREGLAAAGVGSPLS